MILGNKRRRKKIIKVLQNLMKNNKSKAKTWVVNT